VKKGTNSRFTSTSKTSKKPMEEALEVLPRGPLNYPVKEVLDYRGLRNPSKRSYHEQPKASPIEDLLEVHRGLRKAPSTRSIYS
jgi:hypothetical protein